MPDTQDLLHLIARDHRRLDARARRLAEDRARRASGQVRGFVLDLFAHEAVEQLLLHPLVAERLPSGQRRALGRVAEEAELERCLLEMLRREPDDVTLQAALTSCHRHLVEHTDREELEDFPHLRHVVAAEELRKLGRLYATLVVGVPTRLQYQFPTLLDTERERRPLLRVRDVACELLREIGHEPPAGVRPGEDDLAAPVRGVVIDVTEPRETVGSARRAMPATARPA